ncbi:NADH-quinone oxidoreductase subunit E [Roseovarius amoyensis]|uniref:NADH-quinone oxidoreductase subunit E n=1 Tax=Roseovarius amoyensis TaxID=2211448 RepID=UPI000DBE9B5A|nr:NADH-quinone oxidoreductase subunit E [Roseovarius amoyensis]
MLRRLHQDQPDSFAFTPANQAWAEAQITKYPPGRQASAVIALLWRAQEQEGWLTRPAIEYVADMLDMARIRVLEVASFYFMFQLQPVGSVANIQICGTTSCMICGAEDLIGVCREKIAPNPHELSADGKLSWEEVECLGACANAPMAQIGKDYYEDLTAERFAEIIDELTAGKVPVPGPQNGRYASEPAGGLTALKEFESGRTRYNASVQRATDIGDTIQRIDGTEVPLIAPWREKGANHAPGTPKPAAEKPAEKPAPAPKPAAKPAAKPAKAKQAATAEGPGTPPKTLEAARDGKPDDLKQIKGVGPKLEKLLHSMGFFHFDQIAAWTEAEVAWADQNLVGFKGRVSRDEWVKQAKTLAEGGTTEFSKRVKKGDVY